MAQEMLTVLKDGHSLGYYRKVAGSIEPHRIFEALSIVKQLARDGAIKRNRGAAFIALIQASSQTG